MGKKDRDKLQGESGFQSYYSQLYGQRWSGLYQALLKESEPVAWQTEPGRPAYYLDSASIRAAVSLPLPIKQLYQFWCRYRWCINSVSAIKIEHTYWYWYSMGLR